MLGYVCRFVHASEMLIHLDEIEISIQKHYELEFWQDCLKCFNAFFSTIIDRSEMEPLNASEVKMKI